MHVICSIENAAPTISGPVVLYATSGVKVEETYSVSDADGHGITFEIVEVHN